MRSSRRPRSWIRSRLVTSSRISRVRCSRDHRRALDFGAAEVRFGEAAEPQQVVEFAGLPQPEFRGGQGVQAEEMEAALQRIAAEAVGVEPGAAGHQDASPDLGGGGSLDGWAAAAPGSRGLPGNTRVVETLQVVPPVPVLVDLVEHPQAGGGKLAPQDAFPVLRDVPVEVAGLGTGQAAGESRLSDLAGAGDKDHLPLEVSLDLVRQVPGCCCHDAPDYQSF